MNHPSNRPSLENLGNLFTYHAPTPGQTVRYAALRAAGRMLAEAILHTTPPCADQSAALRHVRDAVMTANSAIALEPAEPTEES